MSYCKHYARKPNLPRFKTLWNAEHLHQHHQISPIPSWFHLWPNGFFFFLNLAKAYFHSIKHIFTTQLFTVQNLKQWETQQYESAYTPSWPCLLRFLIILADVVDFSISIVTGSFWKVSRSSTRTGVSSKSLNSCSHSWRVSQAPQLSNLSISLSE